MEYVVFVLCLCVSLGFGQVFGKSNFTEDVNHCIDDDPKEECCCASTRRDVNIQLQSRDDYDFVCLESCFNIKSLTLGGHPLNKSMHTYQNSSGHCFKVDYTTGAPLGGNQTVVNIEVRDKVTKQPNFNLSFTLEYTSNVNSVSWTWTWTEMKFIIGENEQVTMTNLDYSKWKVSVDQCFSCDEDIVWNDSDKNNSITLSLVRMSTGGLFTCCQQRPMFCSIRLTDQVISICLSVLFTVILLLSTSVNIIWRIWKKKQAKASSYEPIPTTNSANYGSTS